ncbi:MAG: hypothetical protein ACRDBL_03820 [Rhabdaerophilum sp.]
MVSKIVVGRREKVELKALAMKYLEKEAKTRRFYRPFPRLASPDFSEYGLTKNDD